MARSRCPGIAASVFLLHASAPCLSPLSLWLVRLSCCAVPCWRDPLGCVLHFSGSFIRTAVLLLGDPIRSVVVSHSASRSSVLACCSLVTRVLRLRAPSLCRAKCSWCLPLSGALRCNALLYRVVHYVAMLCVLQSMRIIVPDWSRAMARCAAMLRLQRRRGCIA